MYVENIRAAHQGLLDKRIVFGTLSYGYGGEPIEGAFTKRGRPRRRIVIDPVTAEIVRRIFSWYVDERLSINEIVRRLNDDPSIPLPPRCTSGQWTRLAVKGILKNARYRALWKYGVTETVYLPEQDYDRQMMRAEPLREIHIEELRIVSDAIWFEAQARLATESRNGGRRSKDGDRRSRPRVLGGLFFCPEHKRPLYVGGAYGKRLYCPSCARLPAKKRSLFTTLNRKLALELTCQKLAELVSADEELVQRIIAACQRQAEAAQQSDPRRLAQLRACDQQLTRSIEFTRKNVGESKEDQAEAAQAIKKFLAERASVRAEIKRIEETSNKPITVPSEAEVRETLGRLGDLFAAAMVEIPDEQAGNVRAIIDMLTGGRIFLYQQGDREPQAGWLQGRFHVRLVSVLTEQVTDVPSTEVDEGVEVVIDYKRPDPFEEEAEQAWELYKQDKLNLQIAVELNCSKSKVTRLLKHSAEKHGETLVDGRSRRAKLAQKHMEPPLYQQIVTPVMKRWTDGMLIEEIAEELGVDRNTVTKVVAHWHTSQGQPVPDGRTRRKQLARKTRRRRSAD
jgi:site-specific DNA recombinase